MAAIYRAHRAVVFAIAQLSCLFSFRFFTSPTGRHSGPIFTIYTSNDAFSRKEVPFGGLEDEFLHLPTYPPTKLKICIAAYGNFERQ